MLIRNSIWLTAATALVTGCCMSMHDADALRAELDQQNSARSALTIRRAAERRGAVLLAELPEEFQIAPGCESSTGLPCLEMVGNVGRFLRLRDPRGKLLIAVPTAMRDGRYERLAEHGSTLLRLVPKVTQREIAEHVTCECDAMPRSYPVSQLAFLLEDRAALEVVDVSVPITEDVIRWICKEFLV